MSILSKIQNNEAVIGVVGLGYVGLPLMLAFASKGFHTVGFDIDQSKIDHIKAGTSYIDHIDSTSLKSGVDADLIDATIDFSRIAEIDAIIMCVPTPLDQHLEPDLSFVTDTMDAVAPYLRREQVVSLESTTYPGTTDEELKTRIEAQGLIVGKDVYLVYSPEREDPGNPEFSSKNIPKVVGGTTPACLEVGIAL